MNLLFPIIANEKDIVYTPDWVAKDMVSFFKPSGRIFDPCKGDGAFLRYMPDAKWCEIREGLDFFLWTERVDWIITNPPFSVYFDWICHSMTIADNFVYLLPTCKPFISNKLLQLLKCWGEIKHMRIYGQGNKLGFQVGFAIGANHFQKGNRTGMTFSYYDV